MKRMLCLFALAALSSCTTITEITPTKSYVLNEVKTTNIGEPFLVAQLGTIHRVKTWVGIMYSPDGSGDERCLLGRLFKAGVNLLRADWIHY